MGPEDISRQDFSGSERLMTDIACLSCQLVSPDQLTLKIGSSRVKGYQSLFLFSKFFKFHPQTAGSAYSGINPAEDKHRRNLWNLSAAKTQILFFIFSDRIPRRLPR